MGVCPCCRMAVEQPETAVEQAIGRWQVSQYPPKRPRRLALELLRVCVMRMRVIVYLRMCICAYDASVCGACCVCMRMRYA